MEYLQEVLDRDSGHLTTRSIGDWITVTELGVRYSVGPRKVRAILHHAGVLAREGHSYRLLPHLVKLGVGVRHDFPRSGRAFDVVSPKGQVLIARIWPHAADEYDAETRADHAVVAARGALGAFQRTRKDRLSTAGEVRWLLDNLRDIRLDVVARALEVSPALVTRYAKQRAGQIEHLKRALKKPLEDIAISQKLTRLAMFPHDAD